MSLDAGEITAIGIGLGNIAAWLKFNYDARKDRRNGTGKVCPLHETMANEVQTLHKENREEHHQLSADIKNLAVATASASAAAATAATAANAAVQAAIRVKEN